MALYQILAFLFVLSGVVFVHELGHFWVARRAGVKVLAFSIGFGRELFGFNDKHGTRWKFCLVPLGGYVRMLGDADETSAKADGTGLTADDLKHAYHTQPVLPRIAIAAAGPVANFIFAILVYAAVFMTAGQPTTAPIVGQVAPESAAAVAGLQPGDRFLAVDGNEIDRFEQLPALTQNGIDRPLELLIERNGRELTLEVQPKIVEIKDRFGNVEKIMRMGVYSTGETVLVRQGPVTAAWSAVKMTGGIVRDTYSAISQMVRGVRSTDELGGPIRIAEVSAEAAKAGILPLIIMMAFLSVNLGLINLLPIPMLDGGHLLFYFIELVRGKPLPEKVQDIGFRIGLALVATLMIFATWNDISRHIFG